MPQNPDKPEPPLDSGGDGPKGANETMAPADDEIETGVGDLYVVKNPDPIPKTGDVRMRIYSVMMLICLIAAYFTLGKKKQRSGG
jgi:LPXTG-motif cell wall-anchored protein